MKYSLHIMIVFIFVGFSETVQAQRGGRAMYRPSSVNMDAPRTHMNTLNTLKRSRRSIWEMASKRSNGNGTRATSTDIVASESLVKEFKDRFGLKDMDPNVSATLTNTLATNREARAFMSTLKSRSIELSKRDRQITREEFVLRKQLVEAVALSGSYMSTFLKDSIYRFGTANPNIVSFRSRILSEAMDRMQIVSPEITNFSRVLNQVLTRNGIGRSERRQCM